MRSGVAVTPGRVIHRISGLHSHSGVQVLVVDHTND
jgi:hypothetical protein